MKKLLLKIAHWILKKYEIVPLSFNVQFCFEGVVYRIWAVDRKIEKGCCDEIVITARGYSYDEPN